MTQLTPVQLSPPSLAQLPQRPRSIEETGLSLSYIADLTVRALYVIGEMTGQDMIDLLHLPWERVLEQVVAYLRREQMVEVKGSPGIGERSYRYAATSKGVARACEVGERNQYLGPAPVPLQQYIAMMERQTTRGLRVSEATIRQAFGDLVISTDLLNQLGPAINSGRSLFLFGKAGNGKTSIAEAAARLLSDSVAIPYAVIVDGQVIRLFDAIHHERIAHDDATSADARWVLSRRPVVVAGGELNMASLDLIFNPESRFYEAPLQMKANGGLLLIDDFGRQQVRPRDLLNRWIVPLEKRVDFLTLHTGKKIEVPFDQLIVFSTNIEPKQLVDEAFLRRIRYKVEVPNPTPAEYREILRRVCQSRNIPYSDDGLRYLLEVEYTRRKLELRSVHPRDLVDQLIDTAMFLNVPPTLSSELLAAACRSYFVEL